MTHGTDQQAPKPTPQAVAVRAAAQAADAHQQAPDTTTLHDMQAKVQAALDLGASPTDIRAARQAVAA